MKCLSENKIFDYLNQELSKDEKKFITEHIESCEKCRSKQIAVQSNIQLVNVKLDLLEPTNIPKEPFVVPVEKTKREQSIYRKILFPSLPFVNWKRALAFSTITICLIFGFLLKNKSEPNYEEICNHVVSIELSFMADPKQDLNENSLYMSFFDGEKMQLEIVRTSDTGKAISRDIIPLNQ